MIIVLEYKTGRTNFSKNIFSFVCVHQILFTKNVPDICWLSTKLSCKISKNLLKMFILMYKFIKFQLPRYTIPQLSSHLPKVIGCMIPLTLASDLQPKSLFLVQFLNILRFSKVQKFRKKLFFSDCTPDNTKEMIVIMQDYGKVVCVLGSAANHHNMKVFMQADASLAIEPLYPQVS